MAGGGLSFTDLAYDASDIGHTYTYTVSEVKGNATGVTYDDTVYTVKVKVSDNGKGGVAVDYSIANGSKLLFENVYTPPVTPETGDSFKMAVFLGLMILSSFGLAAVVICKKRDEAKEEAN